MASGTITGPFIHVSLSIVKAYFRSHDETYLFHIFDMSRFHILIAWYKMRSIYIYIYISNFVRKTRGNPDDDLIKIYIKKLHLYIESAPPPPPSCVPALGNGHSGRIRGVATGEVISQIWQLCIVVKSLTLRVLKVLPEVKMG